MGGPVHCGIAKKVVFAGENHLDKVLEREAAVLVAIKKDKQLVKLAFLDMGNVVVTEEVNYLERIYEIGIVSVNALKGGERGKISDGAEVLSGHLASSFAVTN